jgi:hypothetical protein
VKMKVHGPAGNKTLSVGPNQASVRRVQGALTLRVKQSECEVVHSPQLTTEIKNAWRLFSLPLYASIRLHSVALRHRNNFYLLL